MTIEILPAQLANQIAAGEVVERPASVIKELVENSIDAGATTIKIAIEKGGAKRIRISDNGSGIVKEQLTLALSRHATSKIKNINDLEGINSLGFRGEALASISSVSRLTLTSKPAQQSEAWQAKAEGRDMAVDIQPAAHPDGTTIDVKDLFFNTPARRKFLRTEKTEFAHIEEVVKRIALARLDITFTLIHNEKTVRQYRAAQNKGQYLKRIAQICGQRFVDHAVEVDCQHDDLHFTGWLATPDFTRNQNDLCYSYVNGRMMRDKLINHAIRQAYADLLPDNSYPAFVLFLTLDVREVDVNVHPAKHEVRFHQGRYIHDFIFSVCQQALAEHQPQLTSHAQEQNAEITRLGSNQGFRETHETTASYIAPLKSVESNHYAPTKYGSNQVSVKASQAYQSLMTPIAQETLAPSVPLTVTEQAVHLEDINLLHIVNNRFALLAIDDDLHLVNLHDLEHACISDSMGQRWQKGIVSQPLLLPVKVKLDEQQAAFVARIAPFIEEMGIVTGDVAKNTIQIRQFPALLRHQDVTNTFYRIIEDLKESSVTCDIRSEDCQNIFARYMTETKYSVAAGNKILNDYQQLYYRDDKAQFKKQLLLKSVVVDLTSTLSQFDN